MRRAPIAIGATAVGLATVLGFHSRQGPLGIGPTRSPATGAPSAAGSPGVSTSGGSSTSTNSSSTSSNSTSSSTSNSGTSGSSSSSSGSPPATSASTSAGSTTSTAVRTATGPSVNYIYGILSVKVTVQGKKITNVQIASIQDGSDFRSQMIDQESIPLLEQQALQVQSARIQGVSGASYTSAGFAQSLQGALSSLKI